MKILAEISVGELFDKITILNIKLKKINDPKKLKNIKIELDALLEQSNKLILKDDEILRKNIQKLQDINVEKFEDFLYVKFKEFQSAITPGQFVAIYQKNQLIASGVIL